MKFAAKYVSGQEGMVSAKQRRQHVREPTREFLEWWSLTHWEILRTRNSEMPFPEIWASYRSVVLQDLVDRYGSIAAPEFTYNYN